MSLTAAHSAAGFGDDDGELPGGRFNPLNHQFTQSVLANPVVSAGLTALGAGHATVTGVLGEFVDVARGDGFSPRDIWSGIKGDTDAGFGTAVLDKLWEPSSDDLGAGDWEWWVRVTGSITADVLLDPLSYLGMPGARVSALGGRLRLAERMAGDTQRARNALKLMAADGTDVSVWSRKLDEAERTLDAATREARKTPGDTAAAAQVLATKEYADTVRAVTETLPEGVLSRLDEGVATLLNPKMGHAAVDDTIAGVFGFGESTGLRLRPAFMPTRRGQEGGIQLLTQQQWEAATRPLRAARGWVAERSTSQKLRSLIGRKEYAELHRLALNAMAMNPAQAVAYMNYQGLLRSNAKQLKAVAEGWQKQIAGVLGRLPSSEEAMHTLGEAIQTPGGQISDELAGRMLEAGVTQADVQKFRDLFSRVRHDLVRHGVEMGDLGDTYLPFMMRQATEEIKERSDTASNVAPTTIDMTRRVKDTYLGAPVAVVKEAIENGWARVGDDGFVIFGNPDKFNWARWADEVDTIGARKLGEAYSKPDFEMNPQELVGMYMAQAERALRLRLYRDSTVQSGFAVTNEAIKLADHVEQLQADLATLGVSRSELQDIVDEVHDAVDVAWSDESVQNVTAAVDEVRPLLEDALRQVDDLADSLPDSAVAARLQVNEFRQHLRDTLAVDDPMRLAAVLDNGYVQRLQEVQAAATQAMVADRDAAVQAAAAADAGFVDAATARQAQVDLLRNTRRDLANKLRRVSKRAGRLRTDIRKHVENADPQKINELRVVAQDLVTTHLDDALADAASALKAMRDITDDDLFTDMIESYRQMVRFEGQAIIDAVNEGYAVAKASADGKIVSSEAAVAEWTARRRRAAESLGGEAEVRRQERIDNLDTARQEAADYVNELALAKREARTANFGGRGYWLTGDSLGWDQPAKPTFTRLEGINHTSMTIEVFRSEIADLTSAPYEVLSADGALENEWMMYQLNRGVEPEFDDAGRPLGGFDAIVYTDRRIYLDGEHSPWVHSGHQHLLKADINPKDPKLGSLAGAARRIVDDAYYEVSDMINYRRLSEADQKARVASAFRAATVDNDIYGYDEARLIQLALEPSAQPWFDELAALDEAWVPRRSEFTGLPSNYLAKMDLNALEGVMQRGDAAGIPNVGAVIARAVSDLVETGDVPWLLLPEHMEAWSRDVFDGVGTLLDEQFAWQATGDTLRVAPDAAAVETLPMLELSTRIRDIITDTPSSPQAAADWLEQWASAGTIRKIDDEGVELFPAATPPILAARRRAGVALSDSVDLDDPQEGFINEFRYPDGDQVFENEDYWTLQDDEPQKQLADWYTNLMLGRHTANVLWDWAGSSVFTNTGVAEGIENAGLKAVGRVRQQVSAAVLDDLPAVRADLASGDVAVRDAAEQELGRMLLHARAADNQLDAGFVTNEWAGDMSGPRVAQAAMRADPPLPMPGVFGDYYASFHKAATVMPTELAAEGGVLYRGLNMDAPSMDPTFVGGDTDDPMREWVEHATENGIPVYPGLVSFASWKDMSETFAGRDGVLLRVVNSDAVPVLPRKRANETYGPDAAFRGAEYQPNEAEYMAPPGARFVVRNVHWRAETPLTERPADFNWDIEPTGRAVIDVEYVGTELPTGGVGFAGVGTEPVPWKDSRNESSFPPMGPGQLADGNTGHIWRAVPWENTPMRQRLSDSFRARLRTKGFEMQPGDTWDDVVSRIPESDWDGLTFVAAISGTRVGDDEFFLDWLRDDIVNHRDEWAEVFGRYHPFLKWVDDPAGQTGQFFEGSFRRWRPAHNQAGFELNPDGGVELRAPEIPDDPTELPFRMLDGLIGLPGMQPRSAFMQPDTPSLHPPTNAERAGAAAEAAAEAADVHVQQTAPGNTIEGAPADFDTRIRSALHDATEHYEEAYNVGDWTEPVDELGDAIQELAEAEAAFEAAKLAEVPEASAAQIENVIGPPPEALSFETAFDPAEARTRIKSAVDLRSPERKAIAELMKQQPSLGGLYAGVRANAQIAGAANPKRLQELDALLADPNLSDVNRATAAYEHRLRSDAEQAANEHAATVQQMAAEQVSEAEIRQFAQLGLGAYESAVRLADVHAASKTAQEAARLEATDMLAATDLELGNLEEALAKLEQRQLEQVPAKHMVGAAREQFGDIMTDGDIAEVLHAATVFTVPSKARQHLRSFNTWWRSLALMTPGYTMRNALSALWSNMLAGVTPATSVRIAKAYRAMLTDGTVADPVMERYIENAIESGVVGYGMAGTYQDAAEHAQATTRNPFAGLPVSFRRAEGSRLPRPRVTQVAPGKVWWPVAKSRQANSHVENVLRLASGWDAYRVAEKSDGIQAGLATASAIIDRFHFDYNNLSDAERWMKDFMMPFWTWQARNLPLMIQQAAANPAPFIASERVFENIGSGAPVNPFAPEWFTTQGYKQASENHYIAAELPYLAAVADTSKFMDAITDTVRGRNQGLVGAAASLNPAISFLVEAGTGRSASYGYELSGTDRALAAARLAPTLGTAQRLLGRWVPLGASDGQKARTQSAWYSFAGVPIREVTDHDRASSLLRMEMAYAQDQPRNPRNEEISKQRNRLRALSHANAYTEYYNR